MHIWDQGHCRDSPALVSTVNCEWIMDWCVQMCPAPLLTGSETLTPQRQVKYFWVTLRLTQNQWILQGPMLSLSQGTVKPGWENRLRHFSDSAYNETRNSWWKSLKKISLVWYFHKISPQDLQEDRKIGIRAKVFRSWEFFPKPSGTGLRRFTQEYIRSTRSQFSHKP